MNIQSWLRESYNRIRSDGYDGVTESLRPVKHKALSTGNIFFSRGTSIYDREWDLLIILDACRYDLFAEVADQYNWIDGIDEIRSLDSTTAFWMRRTFTEQRRDEMGNTGYVCGNPFSESELRSSDFGELTELWQSAWTDPGTVPPEAVTDETIRLMREDSHERVIAHYMQPHCPFITQPKLSEGKSLNKFGNQEWRDVWEQLRDGDLELKALWEGYRDNLNLGLQEVTSLLENVEADKVVVTSDHGNAKGEWGVYGHPPNLPLKSLRRVPWVETSANDTGKREPEEWTKRTIGVDRDDQLSSLGYI